MRALKQPFWMLVGLVLLIPFCLAHAWTPAASSINPAGGRPRQISLWKWRWLNTIYGNREDGVSGAEALIWTHGESRYGAADDVLVRVYYRPDGAKRGWMPQPVWAVLLWLQQAYRAYLWSALRNSTNELSR